MHVEGWGKYDVGKYSAVENIRTFSQVQIVSIHILLFTVLSLINYGCNQKITSFILKSITAKIINLYIWF